MLTLPIKAKWFGMILAGIKKEEYRADNLYYGSRFYRYLGQRITIRLRNGYRKDSPSAICDVTPMIRIGGNPEWGADENTRYFVLEIHSAEREATL